MQLVGQTPPNRLALQLRPTAKRYPYFPGLGIVALPGPEPLLPQ